MLLIFLICVISTALLAAGLYLFVGNILHLPSFAITRTALNLSRYREVNVKRSEVILMELAVRAAPFIHMSDFKKKNLSETLVAADISLPPETWIAKCYVKFFLLLLLTIPCLFIFPIMVPLVIILAIRQLLTDLKAADMLLLKKRQEIEWDLPLFASTIAIEIRNTNNVLDILQGYLDTAHAALRRELEITISDIKSGNPETALINAITRVGSPMFSQVFDGLQAVLRGDDSSVYFEIISNEFDQIDIKNFEKAYKVREPKIDVCIALVFLFFMVIFFYVLGSQIHQNLSSFGV